MISFLPFMFIFLAFTHEFELNFPLDLTECRILDCCLGKKSPGGWVEHCCWFHKNLRKISQCPEKAATKGFSFFESAFAFTIKNLPRHFAKQGVGYDLCEQASHFNIYLSCSSRPLLAFNGPSLGTVKLRKGSLPALPGTCSGSWRRPCPAWPGWRPSWCPQCPHSVWQHIYHSNNSGAANNGTFKWTVRNEICIWLSVGGGHWNGSSNEEWHIVDFIQNAFLFQFSKRLIVSVLGS